MSLAGNPQSQPLLLLSSSSSVLSEDQAISPKLARLVALAVAVLFIGSGICQVFPSNVRSSLLGVALVVTGAAILFARSWGYYIAYLIAFSTLLPPQRTWLVPIPQSIRRTLWLFAGMEPELVTVLVSLLCVAALGWTHYVLHRTQCLDRPLSIAAQRWAIEAGLLVSIAAVIVPTLLFIYALIIDPPGPGGPGVPGGGIPAFLVLIFSWPFVLVGSVGTIVCALILKRLPRPNSRADD